MFVKMVLHYENHTLTSTNQSHCLNQLRFKNSGASKWIQAVMKARKALGLKGFVACKKGTAF